MAEKRADYFAAGTLGVWDVDLLGEDVVRVYRVAEPLPRSTGAARWLRRSRPSPAGACRSMTVA